MELGPWSNPQGVLAAFSLAPSWKPFGFLMQQVIFEDKTLEKNKPTIGELPLGKQGANVNVPMSILPKKKQCVALVRRRVHVFLHGWVDQRFIKKRGRI